VSGTERGRFEVVVIGGSQGVLGPLRQVLESLPATFPLPVVVVVHRAPHAPDLLPDILRRRTALPVRAVTDDAEVVPGAIHVAGAGVDLAFRGAGRLAVVDVARDRPRVSADVLFASAARAYGAGALGVVLSGRLSDGASGVRDVKAAGGRVLVQAPDEAQAAGMPAAAMATGCVDFALPARGLAAAVTSLVMVPGAAELFRVRTHPGIALSA
jgi:two-component system chemotaxis response regulator CheB